MKRPTPTGRTTATAPAARYLAWSRRAPSHADFLGALLDEIRQHAEQARQRQRQRQPAEDDREPERRSAGSRFRSWPPSRRVTTWRRGIDRRQAIEERPAAPARDRHERVPTGRSWASYVRRDIDPGFPGEGRCGIRATSGTIPTTVKVRVFEGRLVRPAVSRRVGIGLEAHLAAKRVGVGPELAGRLSEITATAGPAPVARLKPRRRTTGCRGRQRIRRQEPVAHDRVAAGASATAGARPARSLPAIEAATYVDGFGPDACTIAGRPASRCFSTFTVSDVRRPGSTGRGSRAAQEDGGAYE